MNKKFFAAVLMGVAAITLLFFFTQTNPSNGKDTNESELEMKNTQANGTKVLLKTSMGNITIQLFEEKAPITTANFKKLVSQGFYDGTIFHRVIAGFMIQGGDPTGTGTGGPGYTIKDEFVPELKHGKAGILSMANTSQPNTGGSQFFITLAPTPWLDGKHSVFGEVIGGIDVLEAIGKTQTGTNDKPLKEIKIIKAEIVK